MKEMEKTQKYGPLMWELRERNPGYQVKQYNIIIDVLGGYSADLSQAVKELVAPYYKECRDLSYRVHSTLRTVSKFLPKQRGLLPKCSLF